VQRVQRVIHQYRPTNGTPAGTQIIPMQPVQQVIYQCHPTCGTHENAAQG